MNRYVELAITLATVVSAVVIFLYASGFKSYLKLHISKLKIKKPIIFQMAVGAIMTTVILANWFTQFYTIEVFSYFLNLNEGLESFLHTTRGVVDLNTGFQSIFSTSIAITNFFVRPIIAFLGIYLMYVTLNYLLCEIHEKFQSVRADRSILTYYYFTGIFIHIFVNTFLYAQSDIVLQNALVLSLESLAYITMGLLVLIYIRRKEIDFYFQAQGGMLSKLESYILNKSLALILAGIVFYNVLLLPKNFGFIFFKPWLVSFAVLTISVLGIVYAVRKWLFRNLLGALVDIVASSDKNKPFYQIHLNKRVLKYIGSVIAIGVLIAILTSISKLAFIFWITILAFLVVQFFVLLLAPVALVEGAFLASRKEGGLKSLPFKFWKSNYKFISLCLLKASLPLIGVLLIAFTLYTLNPLSTSNYSVMVSDSLLDESGELVLMNFNEQSHPAVEIEGTEWLNRMIIAQEDTRFSNRDNWLFSYNNMHGLNLTNFKGSNLLNQIIKNLSFTDSSDPFSALRKLVELSPSYMLSNKYSSAQLLKMYNTIAGFGDGNGYRGSYLASYRLFNKPLNGLNELEQLLLVETLKYSKGLVVEGSSVLTNEFENRAEDVKKKLINKLISFEKKGHISKLELRRIRRQPLRLNIKNFKGKSKNRKITDNSMSTGTRLFINKPPEGKTSISSISVKSLNAAKIADSLFKIRMRKYLTIGDYKLMNFAIIVDIKKGKVIGHWGANDITSDYTTGAESFGFQFEAGSTMKSLFTALALSRGLNSNDLLYDGPLKGRFSPKNYNRYSYNSISIERALAKSCNICFANMPNVDYPNAIKDLDKLLAEVGAEDGPHDINIILGYNKISIYNLARLYQALFNEGELENLDECLECEVRDLPVFSSENANQVKQWLAATVEYGSAAHLKQILPNNEQFYAKTGTSNSATRGWTILANDDILIVSMVTYMNTKDSQSPFQNTPHIPDRSGGRSAGFFAAYLMNELLKSN